MRGEETGHSGTSRLWSEVQRRAKLELLQRRRTRRVRLSDATKLPVRTFGEHCVQDTSARPLDGDVEERAKSDITPQERGPFTLSHGGTANITDAPLHMFGRPTLHAEPQKPECGHPNAAFAAASPFLFSVLVFLTVHQPGCSRSASKDVMYGSTMLLLPCQWLLGTWLLIALFEGLTPTESECMR